MQLKNKKLKRVLVINKGKEEISLHPDSDVLLAETKMSSTSDKPYIQSFAAITGFIGGNDFIDGVVTTGLRVASFTTLKNLLESSENLRLVSFTINVKSCNIFFFTSDYKAVIDWQDYLALLREHLPTYKIYFTTDKATGYVIIEKN